MAAPPPPVRRERDATTRLLITTIISVAFVAVVVVVVVVVASCFLAAIVVVGRLVGGMLPLRGDGDMEGCGFLLYGWPGAGGREGWLFVHSRKKKKRK